MKNLNLHDLYSFITIFLCYIYIIHFDIYCLYLECVLDVNHSILFIAFPYRV